jgi:hypothetical protein
MESYYKERSRHWNMATPALATPCQQSTKVLLKFRLPAKDRDDKASP